MSQGNDYRRIPDGTHAAISFWLRTRANDAQAGTFNVGRWVNPSLVFIERDGVVVDKETEGYIT